MPRPRVRIVNDDGAPRSTKIYLDGADVSHLVSRVSILPIDPTGILAAELTFVGVEIDIQGVQVGPLITMEIPGESGDALPFAVHFKLLYETSLARSVAPPSWSSYVFVGRDGTFMVEADGEFGDLRILRRKGPEKHWYWEEVEGA